MGRSTTEAIQGIAKRADTPGIRAFSRAIVQGETLGVSIGQILRNLAGGDAQEAEGESRGAGAEGADQDAVPARVAHLPRRCSSSCSCRRSSRSRTPSAARLDMGRRRGTLTLRREDGRIVCEHVKLADTLRRAHRRAARTRTLPPGEGVVLRPVVLDPHVLHALPDRRHLPRRRPRRDQDRGRRCRPSGPRRAAAPARSSSSPPANARGAGSGRRPRRLGVASGDRDADAPDRGEPRPAPRAPAGA